MIPRLKPTIGWNELKSALSPGAEDEVQLFENAFAAHMNQKYAVAFPYGRTGLLLLLQALGFENQEIICPAYTCVVVAHAIALSGNSPVFIDCETRGFNMDLEKVEKAITPSTGAIIATSLFGYPVDLDRLDAIRKRHPKVVIIQDCAHSFAAEWKGRPVQIEGEAALFGLNISKLLTSIFGGMVTTDNPELFAKLKTLRDERLQPAGISKNLRNLIYFCSVFPTFWGPFYGIVNRIERSGLIDHFVRYYDEETIDMPMDSSTTMSTVGARVGRANLERYHIIIENRRAAAAYYFDHLADRRPFLLPPKVEGGTYSHFVVQVENRNLWLKRALRRKLQLGWLIEYNIPEMKAYGSHPPETFPTAAHYARTTINLPVWGGRELAREVVSILSEDAAYA